METNKTPTATENAMMTAKISARILANIAAGMDLPAAIDAVLGAGTYARIAGDVYDALRAA